jgi:hypothetical protein
MDLQMRTSGKRTQASDNAAARKRASATKPTPERADWHWADQQLDEELKDTFPASDALSVTRNPTGR